MLIMLSDCQLSNKHHPQDDDKNNNANANFHDFSFLIDSLRHRI